MNNTLPKSEQNILANIMGDGEPTEDVLSEDAPVQKGNKYDLDEGTVGFLNNVFDKSEPVIVEAVAKVEPKKVAPKKSSDGKPLHVGDNVIALTERGPARGVVRKLSEGIEVEVAGKKQKVESAVRVESCDDMVKRILAGEDPEKLIAGYWGKKV